MAVGIPMDMVGNEEKKRQPVLRHIAARWSLIDFPSKEQEWSLEQKCEAVKAAGFDGISHPPCADLPRLSSKYGLRVLGYLSSGKVSEFPALLAENKNSGARHINVHLGNADTVTAEALGMAIVLAREAAKLGVEPSIEIHRGTCTETPEKAYALADTYYKITGELLPMTWDFSHFAVVRHLMPNEFIDKLLVRRDLIARGQQFHLRPFNGHHCQMPVRDGAGNLTPEMKDWLGFAEAVLRCWLEGNRNSTREIYVCPEMGPVSSGYNLSTLPNSWEDAKILRLEIEKIWKSLSR